MWHALDHRVLGGRKAGGVSRGFALAEQHVVLLTKQSH